VFPQAIPEGDDETVPPPVPALLTDKLYSTAAKLAVTELAEPMVTVHGPVPLHAPDQPVNVDAPSAVGVRVTMAPVVKLAVHVAPQLIPEGDEVTVPPPVPFLLTARPNWITLKLADTDSAVSMVTEQVPVPLHAPDQPMNVDVPPGAAVSVTTVPLAKLKEHVGPQLIPEGDEVTVPPPVPVLATLNPFWTTSKLAVTELAEPMVTVQGPFPLHAPDQPVNVDVPPGAAVSVTTVPLAKLKEHVGPQLIPEGDEVTVPSPVPVLATFNPFWTTLKLAVTELAAFMVTVHGPIPLHAPVHPVNVDAPSAAGVRVTMAPVVKLAVHVAPQLIPAGDDVMPPPPAPVLLTVRLYWTRLKLAVTNFAASTVTEHVPPVPLHAPDQPVNAEAESATAVSVTTVAAVKLAEHVPPHTMPPGDDVTEPPPVPVLLTVRPYGTNARSEDASATDGVSGGGGAVSCGGGIVSGRTERSGFGSTTSGEVCCWSAAASADGGATSGKGL
jgi:hypothetical protein